MTFDFQRQAPHVDWCSPAAYQNPISEEMLDEIAREVARQTEPCPEPVAAAPGWQSVPLHLWCILLAVLVVILL